MGKSYLFVICQVAIALSLGLAALLAWLFILIAWEYLKGFFGGRKREG